VADSCRLSVVSGVVRSRVTGDRLPVLRHEREAAALGGRAPRGGRIASGDGGRAHLRAVEPPGRDPRYARAGLGLALAD